MRYIHPKLYYYDYCYHYYYAIYVDWMTTYMLCCVCFVVKSKRCVHMLLYVILSFLLYSVLFHSYEISTQIQMALVASAIFGFWVVFSMLLYVSRLFLQLFTYKRLQLRWIFGTHFTNQQLLSMKGNFKTKNSLRITKANLTTLYISKEIGFKK